MKNDIFYNVEKDLNNYDATVYVVVGGRSTGKTYSTLKYLYERKINFVFVKRTNNDVDTLCIGSKIKDNNINVDLSPFKPLNDDMGWNIHPIRLKDGIGAFYKCDEENNPYGDPIGWIVSLHAVKHVKGFSMSECDAIVFDEFVPLPYERVDRKEGLQLLDLYRTVQRANFIKGRKQYMILLANAASLSCPVLTEFDLVNDLADMQIHNESIRFLSDRSILIHRLNDNPAFTEKEKENPIYKVMAGTDWAKMSLNNEFAYNDLSNVKRKNLKNHVPVVGCIYKNHTWYIYQREGYYYMCSTPNRFCEIYNLNLENDQKKFFHEHVFELRDICIDQRMSFESYQMYDLIMNYKEFFKV